MVRRWGMPAESARHTAPVAGCTQPRTQRLTGRWRGRDAPGLPETPRSVCQAASDSGANGAARNCCSISWADTGRLKW